MLQISGSGRPKRARLADTLAFSLDVAGPTIAKGVIVRRPAVVHLVERFELDRRAIRRMQALRKRYGEGPLRLTNPVREQILILSASDLDRVLAQTPDPFSRASSEKRAALSHFQPHGSLVSPGPERGERRAFSDDVLESACPRHSLADRFSRLAAQEAEAMLADARPFGELGWDGFTRRWARLVRRVVLGEGAAEDLDLADELTRLRSRANWAFAIPKHKALRQRFQERLGGHLARAEPGSLAAVAAARPKTAETHPIDQVSQWLFAFDPAGMASFRTLALLAGHEMAGPDLSADLRRAAVVETLRLYPTTPMILRQTAQPTEWSGEVLPAGTGVLIYAPFFHRDDERREDADAFRPENWLGVDPAARAPLVPFSAGSGACPARQLVPMLAAELLGALLARARVEAIGRDDLGPERRLPGTLDNFALRFAVEPR